MQRKLIHLEKELIHRPVFVCLQMWITLIKLNTNLNKELKQALFFLILFLVFLVQQL